MKTEQTFKAIFALVKKKGFQFRQPRSWKKFIEDPKEHFHIIFSHEFGIALWGQEHVLQLRNLPRRPLRILGLRGLGISLEQDGARRPTLHLLTRKMETKTSDGSHERTINCK